MKYPRKLSSGANNTVIVLSDTEVAKLFTGDTRLDIGSEAEKMKVLIELIKEQLKNENAHYTVSQVR